MGLISRVSSRTYRNLTMAESAATPRPISKKHLFVRDGMFKAELDEFFKRELAEDGYSGVIVRKRWAHEQGQIDLYVERVANRGLSAVSQAESLRYKLIAGLPVRRAAYGVVRFVMESGAKGCEVIVSGK